MATNLFKWSDKDAILMKSFLWQYKNGWEEIIGKKVGTGGLSSREIHHHSEMEGGIYNQQSMDKVKIDCHIYMCNEEETVH